MRMTRLSERITKALLQLNMTEKEIAAYVCLLENGSLSIQEISRITDINRVTVYAAIDQLKTKGIVSESRRGRRRLFVAENPDMLSSLLKNKKEMLEKEDRVLHDSILPALKIFDAGLRENPIFKFYEGADGINRVFDEYILKNQDIINCGSYETAAKVISFEEEKEYYEDIRNKNILYRVILEDTPLNRKFAAAGKGAIHVKFLPLETKTSADIVVAGKVTALISYDRKTATVIEDASIADAIRMYLEFMWERL